MEQITTTSTLSLFQTNKEERKRFVEDVIIRVKQGHEDPLKVLVSIKCMEEIIKEITTSNEFRNVCIDQAMLHEKSFEFYNAKLQLREVGTKYDFTGSCDFELLEMLEEKRILDEKIKKRQEFIKMLPSEGIEVVNSESGEVNTIYPPAKSSTTSVVVTLK